MDDALEENGVQVGEQGPLLRPFDPLSSPLPRLERSSEILSGSLDLPVLHLGYGGVEGAVAVVLDGTLGYGEVSAERQAVV
jgi:hypothetical protein